jgi:hypothetical protein
VTRATAREGAELLDTFVAAQHPVAGPVDRGPGAVVEEPVSALSRPSSTLRRLSEESRAGAGERCLSGRARVEDGRLDGEPEWLGELGTRSASSLARGSART